MADVVDRRAFDPFAPPPRDPGDPLTPPPAPGRHPLPPIQGGAGTATVEGVGEPGPARDDLDDLSKTELQQRADELGLRTYGSKADLIERIRSAGATAE
jgi:hypothetical protein